jgi:tetratricopeptide (TPR) repeat protein
MSMRHICRDLILIIVYIFVFPPLTQGQEVQNTLNKAFTLIDSENYAEAYNLLSRIQQQQVEELGDSCIMMYNYANGSCLYYLNKFEEAIPCLKKALLKIEKMPHEDCNYLEIIYGIGSCYYKLKQYENAEKYLRRVIIRGNTEDYKCSIKTQTLSELAELYNKLGYTKLAKECSNKINNEVSDLPTENWSDRMDLLLDLAESYEKQGKLGEEIDTYYRIMNLIESNVGKENEDYRLTSELLFHKLLSYAFAHLDANEFPKAQEFLQKAQEILPIMSDKNKLSYYNQYGVYLIKTEAGDKAKEILEEGLKLYTKTNEKSEPLHIGLLHNLGKAYMLQKDYTNALLYLNKSKDLQMQLNGEVMQRTLDYIKECEAK